MKKLTISIFIAVCFNLLAAGAAFSAPFLNTDNGHYYDFITDTTRTWWDAKSDAEGHNYLGVPGHLATITSSNENNFIKNNIPGAFSSYGFFLGGIQPGDGPEDAGYYETGGGWTWITGESWAWTNWNNGAPNNMGYEPPNYTYANYENVVEFYGNTGTWNDLPEYYTLDPVYFSRYYVIEYETQLSAVPEPATMSLLGLGILGLAGLRRKKRII